MFLYPDLVRVRHCVAQRWGLGVVLDSGLGVQFWRLSRIRFGFGLPLLTVPAAEGYRAGFRALGFFPVIPGLVIDATGPL